MCILIHHIY